MTVNDSEIRKFAYEYGTPLFVIDKAEAKRRVRKIAEKLPKNAKLCYAIKANAFLTEMLKDEDIMFEVCSPGELSICEKAGLSPEKIVFSGVVKTEEDVKRAYALKVHTITLESKSQLDHLKKAVEAGQAHKQNVILRLSGGNQFGMNESDLCDCLKELKRMDSINIRGIHFFTGTQKKFKTIAEEIPFIEGFCEKVKSNFSLGELEIEYGAGLPYDYFSGKDERENYSAIEEFSALIAESKFKYTIELGRYIAAPLASYVTKIMDAKDSGDGKSRYCLIDGGINHINYFGQMMGMKVPRIDHIRIPSNNKAVKEEVDCTIAGSLCTTADIVVRKLPLESPKIGDLLKFNDIGAYSMTEGIYLFLSHPLPAVISVEDGKAMQLRKNTETFIVNA